jgi:rod shape-determining protein MreB
MSTTTVTNPATEKKPIVSPVPTVINLTDPSAMQSRRPSERKRILVGFDLGTNASCILAGAADTRDITISSVIPSVVGYAREGLVDGIIAGNATTLIGEEALNHRLQLKMI